MRAIRNKKFLELQNTSTPQDTPQDAPQDAPQDKIWEYCGEPKSKHEIMKFFGYRDAKNFTQNYLNPLIQAGKLAMTIPDKPKSKNQKYVAKHEE